jgi:hypothetical protein
MGRWCVRPRSDFWEALGRAVRVVYLEQLHAYGVLLALSGIATGLAPVSLVPFGPARRSPI